MTLEESKLALEGGGGWGRLLLPYCVQLALFQDGDGYIFCDQPFLLKTAAWVLR